MSEAHFTIAVVGAGPAGASAANALCLGGVRDVALIDRARFPRDKVCGDGITEGAVDVLKEFDLGHLLAPHALISRVVVTAPSGAQAAMEPVAANRRSALPMSSPAKYSMRLSSAQRFCAVPPTSLGSNWRRLIGVMDDGRSNCRASRRAARGGGSLPISSSAPMAARPGFAAR
jgi:2-polyprenyl-6-methoxyphenol hydroxylase-like FAD-dependent oxidoreductase